MQFRQYLANYSSASTDGDLMSWSEELFRVLVCLCGHLVMPLQLRSYGQRDRASFQQFFEAAPRYRETVVAQQPVLEQHLDARLAEGYASKEQYDALAECFGNLERMLEASRDGR